MRDIGGENNSLPLIMKIFSAFMCIGAVLTVLLVPETKGRALEELNGELADDDDNNQELKRQSFFKQYLLVNYFRKIE